MVSKRLTLVVCLPLIAASLGCLEEEYRFGPVGGLRVRGDADNTDACELPPGSEVGECPSYAGEVFPLLELPQYQCSASGCHGLPIGAAGLTMPAGDAQTSYDAMNDYTVGDRNYVAGQNPYFMCNVWQQSPTRIGALMPKPAGNYIPFTETDVVILGRWARCGYPDGGTPPPSSGAGIAGAGGGAGGIGVGGAGGGI